MRLLPLICSFPRLNKFWAPRVSAPAIELPKPAMALAGVNTSSPNAKIAHQLYWQMTASNDEIQTERVGAAGSGSTESALSFKQQMWLHLPHQLFTELKAKRRKGLGRIFQGDRVGHLVQFFQQADRGQFTFRKLSDRRYYASCKNELSRILERRRIRDIPIETWAPFDDFMLLELPIGSLGERGRRKHDELRGKLISEGFRRMGPLAVKWREGEFSFLTKKEHRIVVNDYLQGLGLLDIDIPAWQTECVRRLLPAVLPAHSLPQGLAMEVLTGLVTDVVHSSYCGLYVNKTVVDAALLTALRKFNLQQLRDSVEE